MSVYCRLEKASSVNISVGVQYVRAQLIADEGHGYGVWFGLIIAYYLSKNVCV